MQRHCSATGGSGAARRGRRERGMLIVVEVELLVVVGGWVGARRARVHKHAESKKEPREILESLYICKR